MFLPRAFHRKLLEDALRKNKGGGQGRGRCGLRKRDSGQAEAQETPRMVKKEVPGRRWHRREANLPSDSSKLGETDGRWQKKILEYDKVFGKSHRHVENQANEETINY